MGGFGEDAHLRPGHRYGRYPEGVQRHRQQRDRHLLPGGQQHVHLPLGWVAADGASQPCELISGVAHGRHHDHQIVPCLAAVGDALGYCLDPLHIGHGGAAELLDQQGHGEQRRAGADTALTADCPTWPQGANRKPSRKASPGSAPRLRAASTSRSWRSSARKRAGLRPRICLRIT